MGFITNEKHPFFGYSPDGLVGDDGLIEIKSRDPHLHLATISAHAKGQGAPIEYMAQMQAGLLLSEREWCDFLSFSHGLPMLRIRVQRDEEYIDAIKAAAMEFEVSVQSIMTNYKRATANAVDFTPTERIDYEAMIL